MVRSTAIWVASEHDDFQPRLAAVEMLAGYGPGHADTIIIGALKDKDRDVRMKAMELIVEKELTGAQQQLSRMVRMREQDEREPEELALLLKAYARAGGPKVVSDLARILTQSGKLLDLTKGSSVQADAARALGLIDHESARDALRKGAKSLNPGIRKAAKEALAPESRFGMTGS